MRTEHMTEKLIRKYHKKFSRQRRIQDVTVRVLHRIKDLDALYDSEEEGMTMEDYRREREKCAFDFDKNGRLFFKDDLAKKEARLIDENTDPAHIPPKDGKIPKQENETDTDPDIAMADIPSDHSDDDSDDDEPMANRRAQYSPSNSQPALPSLNPVPSRTVYGNNSYYQGPAGLLPTIDEPFDYGEEVTTLATTYRRAWRRYARWVAARERERVESESEDADEDGDGEGEEDGDGHGMENGEGEEETESEEEED